MDSASHVIRCILNPRFLSYMASCDVVSTIQQSRGRGGQTQGKRRPGGG